MLNIRWKKIFADLLKNKLRFILCFLCISISITSIGFIFVSYELMIREINISYMESNPPSAKLTMDPVSQDLLKTVKELPYIKEANSSRKIVTRIQTTAGEWKTLLLFVMDSWEDRSINKLTLEDGSWPPKKNEIIIERSALQVIEKSIGNSVLLKNTQSDEKELSISGVVHDVSLSSGWMENLVYGYISVEGLKYLGDPSYLNELNILVAKNAMDKKHITLTVETLQQKLKEMGLNVYETKIPEPGQHSHFSHMKPFFHLIQALGIVVMILTGFFLASMINIMMVQQRKEIGLMKAIGGKNHQIAGIYLGMVLVISISSMLVALPLGAWIGTNIAESCAYNLNFNIANKEIRSWVFITQILISLGIPLLVALRPVFRNCKMTVREALGNTDNNIQKVKKPSKILKPFLSKMGYPLILSLRNTFRQKGRMFLMLCTFAFGGSLFMVSLNVKDSLKETVDASFKAMNYDIAVQFSESYDENIIKKAVEDVEAITYLEFMNIQPVTRVYTDGNESTGYDLVGIKPDTKLLDLPVTSGSWIKKDSTNTVVINKKFSAKETDLKLGSSLNLKIGESIRSFKIAGIVKEPTNAPSIYIPLTHLGNLTKTTGSYNNVTFITERHNKTEYAIYKKQLEKAFLNAGLDIQTNKSMYDIKKVVKDHEATFIDYLILVAILVVIISSIGLISIMTINTLERTRELGIMRSVGASSRKILKMILSEGIIIGFVSWISAILLSIPITIMIGQPFGRILLSQNLIIVYSLPGIIAWIGIIIVICTLACLYPALKASKMTVRDALAYE